MSRMKTVAQVTAIFFADYEKVGNARDILVNNLAHAIIAVPRADDVRETYVENLRESLKKGASKKGYAEKSVVNMLSEALRISNTFEDDKGATKFLAGEITYVAFLKTRPKAATGSARKAAKKVPSKTDMRVKVKLFLSANDSNRAWLLALVKAS